MCFFFFITSSTSAKAKGANPAAAANDDADSFAAFPSGLKPSAANKPTLQFLRACLAGREKDALKMLSQAKKDGNIVILNTGWVAMSM
jgi:hypothetical protein